MRNGATSGSIHSGDGGSGRRSRSKLKLPRRADLSVGEKLFEAQCAVPWTEGVAAAARC
jgi:hypothetical protein